MKISFCTTCMDRLFHLKELYLQSIKNVKSYGNVEFILLNYNSKDDLENWVVENLDEHISNGLVKYYKTTEPIYYESSHAKNVVHKLATGDLLCNLDADNLILEEFCEHLFDIFDQDPNTIVCSGGKDINGSQGCCGKIICQKNHFYNVNGYDENIYLGWGMDDTNFQYRCRLFNNLKLYTLNEKWNYCIRHSNVLRTQNFQLKDYNLSLSMSVRMTQEACKNKDYVANKDAEWGKANLIENFHKEISI